MNATGTSTVAWELLDGGVKGVAKKYSQDRGRALTTADGRAVVLTVADGHGSRAHFRSELGARWAVEAFTDSARIYAHEVVRRGQDAANWPRLLAEARSLPQQVVHAWRRRVLIHEANSPAHGGNGNGSGSADAAPGGTAGSAPEADLAVYGSTLVGAVITERLLVCWQLGDGDIVLVDQDGTAHMPFYTGPDMGDETESLCEPEAWRKARLHWQPLTGGPPPGVLISTDGLSKSFADHEGFLAFATGVRSRAASHGVAAVQAQLPDWLGHAAKYSGDDATLAGAIPAPGPGTTPAHPLTDTH
ncbi:protein phosphatase 2C domain-containing protein [Streptomyces sp. IB2014 016-6]|uniref:protein phosphatase 2C domain-containing protein n=1 Tax=Streptomyces sp. IB2014 016-6 TaxID=2517818 RepID=UPI0016505C54|nr:protein phosphatase 2C domain-containing protein [Streptomyces sp. IB2014 016-6]